MNAGPTALEYCIIAAGLSIVIVAGVNGIGSALNTTFKLGRQLDQIAAVSR